MLYATALHRAGEGNIIAWSYMTDKRYGSGVPTRNNTGLMLDLDGVQFLTNEFETGEMMTPGGIDWSLFKAASEVWPSYRPRPGCGFIWPPIGGDTGTSDQFGHNVEQDPWNDEHCPARTSSRPTAEDPKTFKLGRFGKRFGKQQKRWIAEIDLRKESVRDDLVWKSVAVDKGYRNASPPRKRRQGADDESRPPVGPPDAGGHRFRVPAPEPQTAPKTQRQKRNERQLTRESKEFRVQGDATEVAHFPPLRLQS